MADSLLEDRKKDDEKLEEVIDKSLLCGYLGWRPKFLQIFASPKCFLLLVTLFSVCQAMLAMGVTSVSLPDIEKEFGLSSKQSAVILLSNDIAGILLLPVISFLGTHGKKPKWIGIGAIIAGIGALTMCLPKLMIGHYKVPGSALTKSTLCSSDVYQATQQPSTSNLCTGNTGYGSSTKFLAIFALAQFIIGLGLTPLYPLVPAYLDENVDPKTLPIYMGIWFACNFLGQGLGFAFGGSFLKIFTNLKLPKGMILEKKDPRWIGAWWLPFLVLAIPLFLSGLLLLCFPKEMPKYRKKRLQAMNDGKLPVENKKIGTGLKDWFKATLNLLRNKLYMFSTFALAVKIVFAASVSGFLSKIIVLKFGGSFYEVAGYVSAVAIPGSGIGIACGSFVMKRIAVKDSAKKAAMIVAISTALTCFSAGIWFIPGCKTTNLAGAAVPYSNSPKSSMPDSIITRCNANCGCSRRSYQPICGEDGKTYFSPCFAGCKVKSSGGYENCSCITESIPSHKSKNQEKINNTSNTTGESSNQNGFFKAFNGRCDRNCKNLVIFLFLSSVSTAVSFFSAIPQKIMTLRCVPDNQRSYALGFQLVIMRCFSFIPGPLIIGSIIDANCLVWGIDKCGNRGSCLDYFVPKLSKHFFIVALSASGVASILYFLAWFFYVPAETKVDENKNQEMALLETKKDRNEEVEEGKA